MPDASQLTDLQIALLRVLWDRQEATVAEIRLPSCGYRRARGGPRNGNLEATPP
jgi:hypothetical protein